MCWSVRCIGYGNREIVMYYKVMQVDRGELYSSQVVGRYCVKYIPDIPAQAPIGKLFVYKTLEKAAFYYNGMAVGRPFRFQVWKCEVTQPSLARPVPWIRRQEAGSLARYWDGSCIKHWEDWPIGSMISMRDPGIIVKTVTLVSQVPYEVVWDAGGFVLPKASDVS